MHSPSVHYGIFSFAPRLPQLAKNCVFSCELLAQQGILVAVRLQPL
jgi:hypothetical protein